MTHARSYDHSSIAHDHEGKVAELHLDDHAVAQISATPPDDDGFLIRVWPPNGTHEYGGSSLTAISLVVRFGENGKPQLDHFYWDSDR